MSIDQTMYLGPYVESTVEVESVKVDRCEDHKSIYEKDPNVAYCPKCGQKNNELRYYERIRIKPPFEYIDQVELFDETLCQNRGMCGRKPYEKDGKMYEDFAYIPNVTKPGHPERTMHLDRLDEDEVIDMEDLDVEQEKNWFSQAFAKEIKALQENYGNATVKWGIVVWYS